MRIRDVGVSHVKNERRYMNDISKVSKAEKEMERLANRLRILRNKIQTAKAKEAHTDHRSITRKKFLIGAFHLPNHVNTPAFDAWITRDYDRKLFGLPLLGTIKSPAESLNHSGDTKSHATTPEPLKHLVGAPKEFFAMAPTPLKVDYKERDEVKALGATWDEKSRVWIAPFGSDLNSFKKWL